MPEQQIESTECVRCKKGFNVKESLGGYCPYFKIDDNGNHLYHKYIKEATP